MSTTEARRRKTKVKVSEANMADVAEYINKEQTEGRADRYRKFCGRPDGRKKEGRRKEEARKK